VNSSTVSNNSFFVDTRVFNFDRLTGSVSSTSVCIISYSLTYNQTMQSFIKYHGCEFSPNSRYFYFTAFNSILKADLCATNPVASITAVFPPESTIEDSSNKRTMQLAPDGKIYVALNGKSKLGRLNNPNNIGGAATYTDCSLGTYTCQWGLPNFPGYYFEQKPALNFTFTVSPVSCLTASFSSTSVCSNSGYSVSLYEWDFSDPGSGSNNSSSTPNPVHVFSAPGSYTVRLVRQFICGNPDTSLATVIVSSPTVNVLTSGNICGSTTATAAVSGGSGNYQYAWSAGSQTTPTASFTVSGTYTVSVTDAGASGCVRTATTVISVVNLSVSVSTMSIGCYGESSGAATVNVTGGSGNYQYSWNNGPFVSAHTAGTIPAGQFTVIAFDPTSQCSSTVIFSLIQPPVLGLQLAAATSSGLCTGSPFVAVANVNGGTAPVSYLWSNSSVAPTATIVQSSAGAGVLSCTITDANGCIDSSSVTYHYFAFPVLTCPAITVCAGDAAVLQVSGASNYTWTPGGSNSASLGVVTAVSVVYTVSGESNGCKSTITCSVTAIQKPVVNLSSNAPICSGQTLQLFSNPQQGYAWSGPGSFSSFSQHPVIAGVSSVHNGLYTLQATGQGSCTQSGTILVTINPSPVISLFGVHEICAGESVTLTASGANTYTWTPPLIFSGTIVVSPPQTTTYTVQGVSAQGCVGKMTAKVAVSECLGIQSDRTITTAHVFPNPASGKVHIAFANPAAGMIRIWTADGSLIHEEKHNGLLCEFETAGWASGIYLIEVSTDLIHTRVKLILD
jgi:hypothetical protein